jgi:hypothetical protein
MKQAKCRGSLHKPPQFEHNVPFFRISFVGGTAEEDVRSVVLGKNRSSQDSWKTCFLRTPFPRSALFLLTSLWKSGRPDKITEGVEIKVTRQVYL